jgi:hypothetical protein
MESSQSTPLPSAPCELVLKLFSGPRGDVHLARFTGGDDAGRFVMLREVAEASASHLAPGVDLARSIAHPKLLKLLGLIRTGGRSYLACEYVPGAALTELRLAVRKFRSPVRAAVAARIVRDALDASATARELLKDAAGLEAFSAFHPDSIWIAEFGETMVVPVGANEVLAEPRASQPPPGSHSAIDLLLELATALPAVQILADGVDTHLPAALADAVLSALPRDDEARSEADADGALLHALATLEAPAIADELQVRRELERFLGPSLGERRRHLGVNDDEEGHSDANEATVMAHSPLGGRHGSAHDGDEATRILRSAFVDQAHQREHDPDGVTMVGERVPSSVSVSAEEKLPSPSNVGNAGWPQQFLEQTQLSKHRMQSSVEPSPATGGRLLFVSMALAAVALVLTAFLAARP